MTDPQNAESLSPVSPREDDETGMIYLVDWEVPVIAFKMFLCALPDVLCGICLRGYRRIPF